VAKFFNTAGLCFPQDHYMINPLDRLEYVEQLIDRKLCFTIHAPREHHPENPVDKKYLDLKEYLKTWSQNQEKPIVLLVDEIDALQDNILVAVLRQFRDGYQSRPEFFPSSVVLVGMRDVRDYKAEIRQGLPSMGTASPFNIKSDSLLLSNFSREEVGKLLDRHTEETGQQFPTEVKDEMFAASGGQPWLINALVREGKQ
jgi:type II secretory pathway predicted ATPase ExeA